MNAIKILVFVINIFILYIISSFFFFFESVLVFIYDTIFFYSIDWSLKISPMHFTIAID